MEVKGVNPFLFNDDDYTSPNSSNSNPFLMAGDDFMDAAPAETENPFLLDQEEEAGMGGTNPFAFDPMELENDDFGKQHGDFGQLQDFGRNPGEIQASISIFRQDEGEFLVDMSSAPPQKPTDLDLKFTNSVGDFGNGAPKRPPPPRPPPSKETQDLLMSVMGEMDAASNHLLDRIPPTRSPSPISMRDLHSPAPTPEPFGDLLDVGDVEEKKADEDFLGLVSCDVNKNEDVKPQQPPKPPRPQPPQKPPPPNFAQICPTKEEKLENELVGQTKVSGPPPKPPPPTIQPPEDEMLDIFGVQNPVQKTTADIMNLYNSKQETQIDLLSDSLETSLHEVDGVSGGSSRKSSGVSGEHFPVEHEGLGQDFLSPQGEILMDTSDSQSKESVSSVTFNPFAAVEETSPTNPSVVPSQDFSNFVSPKLSPKTEQFEVSPKLEIFNGNDVGTNIFVDPYPVQETAPELDNKAYNQTSDVFDAFAAKFESAKEDKFGGFDAFGGSGEGDSAWGNDLGGEVPVSGFGGDEGFDEFLAMQAEPARKMQALASVDSDEEKDFSVVIRPKMNDEGFGGALPVLAPPPVPTAIAFSDASRINPFDQSEVVANVPTDIDIPRGDIQRTDSQESPATPLFDDDVSQPLETFPRTDFQGEGWEMHLRQPNKKKITGQRFWKKIYVKLVHQQDCVLLQLFNQQSDKDPFQELPLQPCYSVSDIGAQQYDNFGKIFTVKLQYIFYKERPGVRPGQVKKAERITNKLSQFAAYAIQGDYQGCKEFGSDLKKLGLPVEHAPQVSQLMKIGSLNFEDLKQFSVSIEEALFKLQAHRDRALHYKMEEVQVTSVDELYVEQDAEGHVEKQIARVRLFFLGFLTGMPDIELGVNDMRRQGKEVVGRHDIIPVVTEEWIRLENVEFHSCVQQDEYNDTHIIKFKPPDACYIELLRFRVRPPKNRELPLQLKAQICVTGHKVELRADVLVPGFASRKLGQVPCEDVMIRFPIPECWIYMFRVEKHFRYGSVKSAHRRTGKIKGIERILGTVDTLQESLIEVTSGQAKYEHQHRAIVWRCPRLPKEGQGAYTTHNMVCRLSLTSYDQMPDQLAEYCYVEFTMPATQVSHTTVRSVSLQNSDSDEPPEKYVRYLARHEYRVGIEHTEGEGPAAYVAATQVAKPAVSEDKPKPIPEADSSSDSD